MCSLLCHMGIHRTAGAASTTHIARHHVTLCMCVMMYVI